MVPRLAPVERERDRVAHDPTTCRREHIAPCLADTQPDGIDFEARCPVCGHGGFRISSPTRSNYPHIWTCACKRCGCKPGGLRVALLQQGVPSNCLGSYGGPVAKSIHPETARKMDLAISDILATPHLKPADMRVILAEAQGQKVPDDFTGFVKFARGLGIGKTQAQEAAARWGCRPSDCRPLTGGGVVDTSRSTDASALVKSLRSEPRGRSETDRTTVGNRPTDKTDNRRSGDMLPRNARKSVSDQRTKRNEEDAALRNLREAGIEGEIA